MKLSFGPSKKITAILCVFLSAILLSISFILPASALDGNSSILAAINQKVGIILDKINQLPVSIRQSFQSVIQMSQGWLNLNATDEQLKKYARLPLIYKYLDKANLVSDLTRQRLSLALSSQFTEQKNMPTTWQDSTLDRMAISLFSHQGLPPLPSSNKVSDFFRPGDMNYHALNYINYASGATFKIQPPSDSAFGQNADRYQNFYNTITAIQSYNAYVLSELYADRQKSLDPKVPQSKDQLESLTTKNLMSEEWAKQVTTEPLGMVLRDILFYSGQNLATMREIEKLQKEQVTMQAMANSINIMIANQAVGSLLYQTSKVPPITE